MLANVGFLLSVLSDFKGAQLAGDQAMTLLNKVKDSRKVKARVLLVVHSAIRCWLGSIALSIKSLLAGYEAGLATGDIESSCWCIYFYLEYRFRTGARLDAFVVDCAFYAGRLHELQMLKNLQALRYLWQVVLFLTGANSFDGTLTGDVVSEEAELSAASDSSERHHILMSMYRVLMYAQFMLGRHNLVYDSIRKTRMDKGGHEKQAPALAGKCCVPFVNQNVQFLI
jgi:predicted ATPase